MTRPRRAARLLLVWRTDGTARRGTNERDPGWLIVFAPSLEGGAPLYWAARVRYPFIGLELATAAQLVRLHGSARCWVWLETPCGIVWTYNLHDPAAWRELVDELKARPGSGEWAG